MSRRDKEEPSIDRRRILQGVGAMGTFALAGCLGGDGTTTDAGGDTTTEGDSDGVNPIEDPVSVDPADIQEGGTFRTAVGANPDSFDYLYSTSAEATVLMNLIYEGMITTDATGKIYPWIAESFEQVDVQDVSDSDYSDYMVSIPYAEGEEGEVYVDTDEQIVIQHPDNDPTSDDEAQVLTVDEAPDAVEDGTYGTHYRFELHEEVTFHNGEELTAESVIDSYNRAQGSSLSGQVYDALLHIEADGDYTVDLYTQLPDATAVRELGGLPIYPSEMANLPPQEMDPRQDNDPIGTGPFVFEEFSDEEYAVFSRNEDYWFDKEMKDWYEGSEDFPNGPVVDEVDVSIIPDPAQRSAALQNDELDMAFGLTSSTLTEFDEDEEYRTAVTLGAGFTFMQFPVTVEPFDDARVRRAVNHLIPREQVSENIFDGWEEPAWVPLPPLAARAGTTDYDQLVSDLRSYNEYNREDADALVEEAVDEEDIDTPIEVTIETNSDNDDRVRTVELIVQSLNESEYFEVDMETYEFVDFMGRVQSEDYAEKGHLAFVGLSGGFDPHGYAKSIHHPDNYMQCCNFQNLDFEEFNEALQKARYGVDVTEDLEVRQQRYDEIWEMILELNGNSYGTHSKTIGVVRDRVKGFNTYPSTQNVVGYGLYNPMDEQITYLEQ